jgi:AcrR family transcriptional regulator
MGRTKAKQVQAKRQARNARRRGQTRDEILDAACHIVLRDGFYAFTLAAVADELGLTNPALYYYFDSKEALLFELLLREWLECGAEVAAAVEATQTGADAVETLIRAVFARYCDRLDMFMLVHQKMVELRGGSFPKEGLERIRPVNDMLYAGAESRLRADQATGVFPKSGDPRRFVFTAHMAAIGLLNMRAITAAADDPLIHSDEDLVDDLCKTFRHAAMAGEIK